MIIEDDLMKKWANSIFYEDLMNNLSNGFKFSEKLIEKKCKEKKYYKMAISQTKFQKIKYLKDNLCNNKEYKLITDELWKNICKPNAQKENGIKFFISKNTISLIFNQNEKLDFKINKFIISKSTLIENENSLNNKEIEKNGDDKKNINNEISKIDNKSNNDLLKISNITPGSDQFQNEKMILIKLFLFQKELNQKIDKASVLNNEIFSHLYLIPKSWLDEFKSVFFYKDIKEYLKINQEKPIGDIIKNLPEEYNKKINEIKDIKPLQNIELKYDIGTKKISESKEIKYITNFDVINQEIFELLKATKYLQNTDIKFLKECRLFKLTEKILLKLNKEENDFKDLIGNFDENTNFIGEYILEFKEKINLDSNKIRELIINFDKSSFIDSISVRDKENKKIGFCYIIKGEILREGKSRITEIKQEENKENTYPSNTINGNNENELKNNPNTDSNNYEFEEELVLDPSIKKDLLALIKYNKYFKEKIEQSEISPFKVFDIYLVNENWFSKLKNYYNYNDINEKLGNKKEISSQNLEQILKETNLLKQYIDKQNNSNGELNLIKSENCKPNFKNINNIDKVISYPTDFDIIDKEIFKDIIPNDIISGVIECLCIINSGKIIIRFEDEKLKQYNFLIGNMDVNNNKFCLELILDYKNKNCLIYHFSRLKDQKYEIFVNNSFSEDKKILHVDINLKNGGDKLIGSIINLIILILMEILNHLPKN